MWLVRYWVLCRIGTRKRMRSLEYSMAIGIMSGVAVPLKKPDDAGYPKYPDVQLPMCPRLHHS